MSETIKYDSTITDEMRKMDRQTLSDFLWGRADAQGERPLTSEEKDLLDSIEYVSDFVIGYGYPYLDEE